MSTLLASRQTYSRIAGIGRKALSALCKGWTAHTLRRAIARATSMQDEGYRDFGLDKAEILAALTRLHEDLQGQRSDCC